MIYASAQDLIDELGEREATALSDREKTGLTNVAALDRALANATDEVNAYVGRRYALPLGNGAGVLTTAPTVLQRLTIDVARYRMSGTEIMETEAVRNRFKDAVKLLEQIASGLVSLGDLSLAPTGGPASVGGTTAVRTGCKTFGSMAGVL